jgi:hypothetical protein
MNGARRAALLMTWTRVAGLPSRFPGHVSAAAQISQFDSAIPRAGGTSS